MDITVGTCGNCGGRVTIAEFWSGSAPQTPRCKSCGAATRPNYGRVLDMVPPEDQRDRCWELTDGQLKWVKC